MHADQGLHGIILVCKSKWIIEVKKKINKLNQN